MAYRVNVTDSPYQTPATTYPVTLGAHQDGDLLLVKLVQDGAGATNIAPNAAAVTAGWAMIGTQAQSQSCRSAWAYKYVGAGQAPVSNPTFTGNNDDWIGTCIVIRDADPTTPIRNWMRSDWGNSTNISTADSNAIAASSAGGTTVFTPLADSLLLYSWNCDGGNSDMRTKLSDLVADSKYGPITGEPVNYIAGHRQLNSAAVPAVTMYANTQTEGGNGWVIEIANKSGGTVQPMARVTAVENSTIANWFGDFGARHLPITWAAPSAFCSASSINGITLSTATPTVSTAVPDSDSRWGNPTQINDGTSGTVWAGGSYTFAATDVRGKTFSFAWGVDIASTSGRIGAEGVIVFVGSSTTDWAAFQLTTKAIGWKQSALNPAFIQLDNATPYASAGTVDYSAITRVAYLWHKISGVSDALILKNATLLSLAAITGGSAALPASFKTLTDDLGSWGHWRLADKQASSQIQGKFSTQIGDGTSYTYFDSSASSFEFPRAFSESEKSWNVNAGQVGLSVYGKSGDTINLSAGVAATETQQLLTINASHSTGATFSVAGESFVGWNPTWKTGVPSANVTFRSCGIIDFKAADIVNVIANNGTGTALIAASDGFSATGCQFTASATAIYGIRIAAAGTFDLDDVTFSGFTKDIDVTAATGTVTIVLGIGQPEPTYQTAGATIVFDAPAVERGLSFTGLVAGSQVVVCETGTQDELFRDDASSTSEEWSEAVSGSLTVDYTIMKAGYLPIRVTGVTVTGAISGGVLTVPVQQIVDRAYAASSGLTFGSTATVNAGAKTVTLSAASTVQNWYSFMIESWIAQSALVNVRFPFSANGPNSFTLGDGWVWGDGATSIAHLSRDGMRYVNTSGNVTAIWVALLSVGVPSGMQVRYQQADGSGTTNAANTGEIDQLVQVLSDPNGDGSYGDGYDKRGHLVLKVQAEGYDEAEFNAVATYGTLEDQFYVAGLAPTPNGIAAGGTYTGLTLTDHGASPVTWNSKAFSLTITDTLNARSGTEILQWIRNTNAFNYGDLVRTNGDKFKTVRGAVYGDVGAALKGVRVVKADGTTPHNDFNLFTADDGTTYTPPVAAPISWADAEDGTTVLLYNDSDSGALVDTQSVTGGSGYLLDITLPHADVAVGDILRLRHGNKAYYAGELVGVMTANGLAFAGAQTLHPVYAAWGLDGADYDQANGGPYTMDGANIDVDIVASGFRTKKGLGAWIQYLMTLPAGLDAFYGGWDLLAPNQIRQNVEVVDVLLHNTSGAGVSYTDQNVNYYRSDFSPPWDPSGDAIHIGYDASPFIVTTSDQAVNQATVTAALVALGYTSNRAAMIEESKKLLRNKRITNPATGTITYYDDNSTTPLYSADLFEDADGTQPYRGRGAERQERLT